MTRRDAGNVLPESSNNVFHRILYFILWCWFNLLYVETCITYNFKQGRILQ